MARVVKVCKQATIKCILRNEKAILHRHHSMLAILRERIVVLLGQIKSNQLMKLSLLSDREDQFAYNSMACNDQYSTDIDVISNLVCRKLQVDYWEL